MATFMADPAPVSAIMQPPASFELPGNAPRYGDLRRSAAA
jgi:hypothetical protein